MNKENSFSIIFILGPTAVGKSKIAINLAKTINAEIISADSMSVYKGMDIGTDKPCKEERQGVAHHLIDIRMPYEEYTVSDFVVNAREAIKDIIKKGKQPIICGGTNYYIYTLIQGEYECPAGNEDIRQNFLTVLEKQGKEKLFSLLTEVDPVTAQRLHINDTKRIIRALEVYELTGKPMSLMSKKKGLDQEYSIIKIGLFREKQELHERVLIRVSEMLDKGLIKEVEELIGLGLEKSKTASQAVGYRETIDYIKNKCEDLDFLREEIAKATRGLVKRQLTWLRKDATIEWFDLNGENDKDVISRLVREIQKNLKKRPGFPGQAGE